MACYRRISQSIADTHPIEVLVDHDTVVEPGQHVLVITEGVDDEGETQSRAITTHRLVTDAKVVDIRRIQTHILGEPAERVRLKYECVYGLGDGDKVTTRHGHKGVVRVLPDADMPHVEMPNGDWQPLEALIHPLKIGRAHV